MRKIKRKVVSVLCCLLVSVSCFSCYSALATTINPSEVYQNDVNSSSPKEFSLRDENPSMHYEKLRITGIKSLNNLFDCVDYKVTQSNFIKYANRAYNDFNTIWGSEYDYLEKIVPDSKMNQYRPINGDAKESWLLNNGYLSVPKSYKFEDTLSCTSNSVYNDDDEFYLSDFLMSLYKSVYGVIESRPVMHKSCSHRDGLLVGEGNRLCCGRADSTVKDYWLHDLGIKVDTAIFEDIDRTLFISPDVYELYLYRLYNLGVIGNVEIGKQCLGSVKLIQEFMDIERSKRKPDWYCDGSSNPYMITGGGSIEKSVLGSSTKIIATDSLKTKQFRIEGKRSAESKYISNDLEIKRTKPNFMMHEEGFSKMDCLKLIESILKTKEKNLSNEEANIIAYKFGSGFLINLDNKDKETVTYLTAKGIIKPNSIDYVAELYSPATKQDCIDYLYRVSNKDFRLDFSKVQLTDSDRFWQEKGFVEQEFKIVEVSSEEDVPYLRTLDITTPNGEVVNNVDMEIDFPKPKPENTSLNKVDLCFFAPPSSHKPNTSKVSNFKIRRIFSVDSDYSYNGKKIKDSKAGDKDIEFIGNVNYNGRKCFVVTFSVNNPSVNDVPSAIAYLNSRTKLEGNWNNNLTFKGVSKVDSGGKLIDVIPKSYFESRDSEIQCIGDKYLVNVKTGAEAIISPEDHLAIVGNSVIKSDSIMIFSSNKEVFYDFSIISALMTNTFVSEIDPWSTYVWKSNSDIVANNNSKPKKINDDLKSIMVPVIGSTGQEVQRSEVLELKNFPGESNTKKNLNVYNKTLLTKGVNSLSRTFSYDKKTYTLIVDWAYAPPEGVMFKNFDLGKVSVGEMSEYMYKRPDDEIGRRWWDLNLKISNILCNMIYETKGIEYVKSGFLVPKVILLGTNKLSNTIGKIDISNVCNELNVSENQFYKENPIHTVVTTLMNEKFDDEISYIKRSGKVPNFQSLEFLSYKYSEMSDYRVGFASNLGYYVNGNTVYQSIDSDYRLNYKNKALHLETRYSDPNCSNGLSLGSRVRINNEVFIYYGSEGGYHKLMSTNTFSGKSKMVNGKFVVRSGSRSVIDYINNYVKSLPGGYKIESEEKSSGAGIGTHLSVHTGIFLEDGEAYDRKSENIGNGVKRIENITIKEGDTVNTLPIIYLDINKWVYNKGFMEYGGVSPYSLITSLFYSGINNSLIDSIVFKCYDTKKVSDLSDGKRLTIGDICFVKQGNKYVSTPININVIKGQLLKNPQKFKNYLTNVFGGITISYSQRTTNFIKYIKNIDFGEVPKDVIPIDTLVRSKGYMKVHTYNGMENPRDNFSNAKTFCIEMELEDDDLYCRKLNKSSDVYQLLFSTDRYGEGYLENLPFLIDTINLSKSDDYLFFSSKSKFQPIEKFNSIVNFLRGEYKKALSGDVKSFIRMLLVTVVSYLIVMSWVCLCFIKGKLGYTFLNALKKPDNGNKGFDLLKILSLGMYNIDTEIKYHVLFISNIIMFAILHILLNF